VLMAITKLPINEFLSLAKTSLVLDVRSPGEFLQAHIPGAHNISLFTDEERKVVGTAYKQQSKQAAIKIGLSYFGVKLLQMVEAVEEIIKTNSSVQQTDATVVLVHCWRGGMRSAGVAWLLDLYGYKVYTLIGGYKAYRNWVLAQFEKVYPMAILGGYTGSGKTEVLHALAKQGANIIDLEGLANHKGSAFGAFGQPEQPSQEYFENKLALVLSELAEKITMEPNGTSKNIIWIEDESQRIGNRTIPTIFFQQMRKKQVYFLNIPFDERLNFIDAQYGQFEKTALVNAVIRIKKRLGGLETKNSVNYLIEDQTKEAFRILLHYYDRLYFKALSNNREDITTAVIKVEATAVNPLENAALLVANL
jgi:tRNA 2-selenouridine synthase